MNRQQKNCLWVGIGVIVVMGNFPPWLFSPSSLYRGGSNVGYHYIFSSPRDWDIDKLQKDLNWKRRDNIDADSGYFINGFHLDISRLCIQWFMVAIITGGLIITIRDKKPKEERGE